jgi:hypothetical protein
MYLEGTLGKLFLHKLHSPHGKLLNHCSFSQVALAIFKLCEPQLLLADDIGAAMQTIKSYELG